MKTYLRTTKNLYSDIVNGYQVFYSYNTTIGINDNGKLILCQNVWSTTTGRHLTWIDGGSKEAKKSRLKHNDFINLLREKQINQYYN